MLVRLQSPATRARFGGETAEVDDETARGLIASGVAVEIKAKKKKTAAKKKTGEKRSK